MHNHYATPGRRSAYLLGSVLVTVAAVAAGLLLLGLFVPNQSEDFQHVTGHAAIGVLALGGTAALRAFWPAAPRTVLGKAGRAVLLAGGAGIALSQAIEAIGGAVYGVAPFLHDAGLLVSLVAMLVFVGGAALVSVACLAYAGGALRRRQISADQRVPARN